MSVSIHYLAILCSVLVTSVTSMSAAEPLPPEFSHFVPHLSNPLLKAGQPTDWDARLRERGWILITRGKWWMWYTGYDGERSSIKQLGLATSSDGINWQKHSQNPLTTNLWVEDMMVVEHEGTFHMFAEGRNDHAHHLTSKDGIDWKSEGTLDIRMKNGEPINSGPFGTPTAFLEDNVWYLFYERHDAGIWVATSQDLKTWTHLQDTPVMKPGPSLFDQDYIALNQIFTHNDRYFASIHGSSKKVTPSVWASGLAVSDDLIHWVKYDCPVRPISENKSSGLFIHDGKQLRFYTMHDQVHLHLPSEKTTTSPR